MLGYAHMVVSTYRKLQCLSACQNFILHFFPEILNFKQSCNYIGQKHFDLSLQNLNFTRNGISGEISITILILILHYLLEILMTNFFKKPKNLTLGPFWNLFAQIYAKMSFSEKKPLPAFKYSYYLPSCKKTDKTNNLFRRKMLN